MFEDPICGDVSLANELFSQYLFSLLRGRIEDVGTRKHFLKKIRDTVDFADTHEAAWLEIQEYFQSYYKEWDFKLIGDYEKAKAIAGAGIREPMAKAAEKRNKPDKYDRALLSQLEIEIKFAGMRRDPDEVIPKYWFQVIFPEPSADEVFEFEAAGLQEASTVLRASLERAFGKLEKEGHTGEVTVLRATTGLGKTRAVLDLAARHQVVLFSPSHELCRERIEEFGSLYPNGRVIHYQGTLEILREQSHHLLPKFEQAAAKGYPLSQLASKYRVKIHREDQFRSKVFGDGSGPELVVATHQALMLLESEKSQFLDFMEGRILVVDEAMALESRAVNLTALDDQSLRHYGRSADGKTCWGRSALPGKKAVEEAAADVFQSAKAQRQVHPQYGAAVRSDSLLTVQGAAGVRCRVLHQLLKEPDPKKRREATPPWAWMVVQQTAAPLPTPEDLEDAPDYHLNATLAAAVAAEPGSTSHLVFNPEGETTVETLSSGVFKALHGKSFILLDATADLRVLQRLCPRLHAIDVTVRPNRKLIRVHHVRQSTKRSRLKSRDDEGCLDGAIMRRILPALDRCQRHESIAVIVPKFCRPYFTDPHSKTFAAIQARSKALNYEIPVSLAHFGALRGLNTMKDADHLVIFTDVGPNQGAMERLADHLNLPSALVYRAAQKADVVQALGRARLLRREKMIHLYAVGERYHSVFSDLFPVPDFEVEKTVGRTPNPYLREAKRLVENQTLILSPRAWRSLTETLYPEEVANHLWTLSMEENQGNRSQDAALIGFSGIVALQRFFRGICELAVHLTDAQILEVLQEQRLSIGKSGFHARYSKIVREESTPPTNLETLVTEADRRVESLANRLEAPLSDTGFGFAYRLVDEWDGERNERPDLKRLKFRDQQGLRAWVQTAPAAIWQTVHWVFDQSVWVNADDYKKAVDMYARRIEKKVKKRSA